MSKLRVGVIFGGRSGEHEVSLVSGSSVMNALDRSKYEVIPIGITKSGKWLVGEQSMNLLKEGKENDKLRVFFPAEPEEKRLLPAKVHDQTDVELPDLEKKIDVIIPVLHGTFGEDGTIQGLLELAEIPYVGACVLGSALCMDKIVQKHICRQAGLPVVEFLWFRVCDWQMDTDDGDTPFMLDQIGGLSQAKMVDQIIERLGLPVFVKPPNLGSSVGIYKAHDRQELIAAINEAANYDRKIIVEKAVLNAREIEVSILGNENPRASVVGEVIPSNEFYDYDAKYVDGASGLEIPANLPQSLSDRIRETAIKSFLATEVEGMARVDLLLERDSERYYLSELNTIPGFTQISMYPKLWQASGLSYSQLLDELIRLALERHERKQKLRTSYTPKETWYR